MQQIKEMPKTTVLADLYCYGNLLTTGIWGGVQLSYLLDQTGARSYVNSIHFIARDSYTVSIPMQVAQAPQTILAYEKDGQPLSEALRLVLPGANGASWIAQIISITMSESETSLPPINGGMAKDILSTLNDNRVILQTPPTTLAPSNAPTVAPTPNPTPIASPSPNSTLTPSPPPRNPPNAEPTDYILIISAIPAPIIALAVLIYWWHQKNSKLKKPQQV